MISSESTNSLILQRIANHLILNASFLNNLGLYHGKMGIVLFFAHYARYTENSLYDDFAGELLDEIYEEIHDGLPVDLENGLCGIGWGILYLLQNGFMEGNPNDILIDIDKKIMERDLRRITDFSVEKGLMGISCYIERHINIDNQNAFDCLYISDWMNVIPVLGEIEKFDVFSLLRANLFDCSSDIGDWNLGINDGCAGYGLRVLLS